MERIAFLGTGLMGAPMARRLIAEGYELRVWNRSPAKTDSLCALGAHLASSPSEAAHEAKVVVTMLADPTALEAVALGEGGFLASMTPPAVWVDMSTVGPDCFLKIAHHVPEGCKACDAPVLGSVPQATDGSLDIFAGCDEEVYESLKDLLSAMGDPRHVGPLGAGAAIKLVLNSALVSLQCVLGECLLLGNAFGLGQSAVLDALERSSLAPVVGKKRSKIESGDYSANFTVVNGAKDAYLVHEAAQSRNLKLPVELAAKKWFDKAASEGYGSEDYSAVVKTIRLQR